ncbi:hypothetical protein [Geodermatophilus ruber]|uniref:hypothetical protein n=1 Tax=Geodermatophilus ruber TaxID=504800 RepID=UPI0015A6F9B7|nr:hypothetical protein [Geodermatophilus ruber]
MTAARISPLNCWTVFRFAARTMIDVTTFCPAGSASTWVLTSTSAKSTSRFRRR